VVSFRKILATSQESALIALLLVVGGITGARDALSLVAPKDLSLYFILLLFVGVAARVVVRERRVGRIAPLPAARGRFDPFGGIALNSADLWPRTTEAAEFAERVRNAVHSHLIVSGPSGAGKSTLVSTLVAPLLEPEFSVLRFDEYDALVLRIIDSAHPPERLLARQRGLCDRYVSFVRANRCRTGDVFEPNFQKIHPDAARLWREIESFMAEAWEDKPPCFVFDQIERYLQGLEASRREDEGLNGCELFLFMRFLKWCAASKTSRSVFIIRSDHLYESIDFLDALATSRPRQGPVEYVLCHGINTATSPAGVKAIRDAFRNLGLGAAETGHFDHVCRLDSRTASNTFMTQMVGYVVENFYASDESVRSLLRDEKDRQFAIRCYFRHFLNDFVRKAAAPDPMDLMKVTLFSIATENMVTGRGASIARIAALAHMPGAAIEEAVGVAVESGVLLEELPGEAPTYRLVHDIVSDHVLENEQFSMHPLLKDSIRGLSERRVPTRALTRVESYANIVTDLWGAPNLGLVAIWVFIVFGAMKARSAAICLWSWSMLDWVPGTASCSTVLSYYLAVYVLHIVWLIFIYHVHREYLRVVLRTPLLRRVSGAMPVIGAALAVLLSQSPSLFVIPIVCVGLMMGTLLLLGVADGSFVGADAPIRRNWGIRTLLNMIITSGFSLVTALVLWRDTEATAFWRHVAEGLGRALALPSMSPATIATIWIYAASLIMIYFWLHIRPEQQSRVASAARLAAYDRARSEADD
jgi:hypothetical protein